MQQRALRNPLLGAVVAALTSVPGITQRNVLIVVADDLGVDGVASYREGANPPPTPTIDGLAARGVLFRNAWANPVCSPTRAGMFTGRHAFRTLVGQALPFNTGVLADRETTLPEALDRGGSGYAHALIGKWHLGSPAGGSRGPNRAGWSHFAGLLSGGVHDYFDWDRTENGVTANCTVYATTQIVDDAIDWIDRQRQPWLCVVSFNAPHTPFHAPPPSLHSQSLAGLDPTQTPVPFFRAMVEAMDRESGRLLRHLGSRLANTNVIFVGDNGTTAEVSEPPFQPTHAKATPYEGGVNVPLIIAGPDVAQGGREVGALVSAVDLFATCLDLVGVDAEQVLDPWMPIDAISVMPILAQPGAVATRSSVFTELFFGATFSGTASGFAAAREARYKLVRRYPAPTLFFDELYDLRLDPFETTDLLAAGGLSPRAQDAYEELDAVVDAARSPAGGFHVFGVRGCTGSNGSPGIGGTAPTVGAIYQTYLYSAPPGGNAILATGSSNTSWRGLALPWPLSGLGAGFGCALRTGMNSTLLVPIDGRGLGAASIPLPADRDLIGQVVFHQWLVVDPRAPGSGLGLTTSDAAAALIGG